MRADRTPIEEGYAFYDALLDELRDAKITPYATLHHWDFPDWLCDRGPSADDASLGAVDPEGASRDPESCPGAWLDPGVVADFQTYADQAFARLGPKVHFWATINEPKTVANMGYGAARTPPASRPPPRRSWLGITCCWRTRRRRTCTARSTATRRRAR